MIRKLLIKSDSNVNLNDEDKYGDGDKTLIKSETQRQILRNLWLNGSDVMHHLRERFSFGTFSANFIAGNT